MQEYELDREIDAILEHLGVTREEVTISPPVDRLGEELERYHEFTFDIAMGKADDSITVGEARANAREQAFADVGALAFQIALAHPDWARQYLATFYDDPALVAENAEVIFDTITRE